MRRYIGDPARRTEEGGGQLRPRVSTASCRTATPYLGSPMADSERSEILLFKQPQQQVARFAGSTCPATPGRAHRLHGTCTLDPGRASGELRSQKTCPLGRDVYSGPWTSFQGSYGVRRRARRDDSVDPLGFTRMPGVSIPHIRQQLQDPWTSLYNGRVPAPSDGALRALDEPAARPGRVPRAARCAS